MTIITRHKVPLISYLPSLISGPLPEKGLASTLLALSRTGLWTQTSVAIQRQGI